uniref:Uncharacterized protein n=1 Tax=Rhizophora mucronata TaxID=61149 RepID=A0A2P2NM01_RHIMU
MPACQVGWVLLIAMVPKLNPLPRAAPRLLRPCHQRIAFQTAHIQGEKEKICPS